MEKKSFIVIFLFAFISCINSETESHKKVSETVITESDIYEVVNYTIQQAREVEKKDGLKKTYLKYLYDKDLGPLFNKIDSMEILMSDTIFSKEDLKFIERQISNRKDFRFNKDSIKSIKVISADRLQEILDERIKNPGKSFVELYESKYGNSWFYTITIGLPVFSNDKKTVFVKFTHFGSGYTMVLKKVKGKWVGHKSGSAWIS